MNMETQKSCHYIQIFTPKRYLLDGLWFGGDKPQKGIVFVHGLASTAFAHHDFLAPLSGKNIAAIFFSNRGHDNVTGIKKINRKTKKGYTRQIAGEAHEVFTDCVDDIQGVVDYLLKKKVKDIYLVGHSTGCQKIVYYLSRKNKQRKIRGAVLLCPLSDYAIIKKSTDSNKLKRAEQVARKLIKQKKSHEFLPSNIWSDLLDAQRFLSLYTPDSKEEIFTYAQPRKIPRTLRKVRIPLLAVFAGNDEYRDRGIKEIAKWFENSITSEHRTISIIPNALHSFNDKENQVVKVIGLWLKAKK